jgi:hypothetical protein
MAADCAAQPTATTLLLHHPSSTAARDKCVSAQHVHIVYKGLALHPGKLNATHIVAL